MISFNPRLPDNPEEGWVSRFRDRFYLLWGELAVLLNTRFDDLESQGQAAPSASTLALGVGNRHHVTGTTTVNLISKMNLRPGTHFILHFEGSLTLKHNQAAAGDGKPMMLTGAADVAVTANDQIQFQYDNDGKLYQIAPVVTI